MVPDVDRLSFTRRLFLWEEGVGQDRWKRSGKQHQWSANEEWQDEAKNGLGPFILIYSSEFNLWRGVWLYDVHWEVKTSRKNIFHPHLALETQQQSQDIKK